jgi:hypothetical protein
MATDNLENLMQAMERERAAFDRYVLGQRDFGEALMKRDWPALERAMANLGTEAAAISDAEVARSSAETFFRLEKGIISEGLSHIALAIPEPKRGLFTDLHRSLKVAAMRAKLENEGLGDYAIASRDLLGAVLDELFPEKKGKIYGPSGRAIQRGHDSLVLNTAL